MITIYPVYDYLWLLYPAQAQDYLLLLYQNILRRAAAQSIIEKKLIILTMFEPTLACSGVSAMGLLTLDQGQSLMPQYMAISSSVKYESSPPLPVLFPVSRFRHRTAELIADPSIPAGGRVRDGVTKHNKVLTIEPWCKQSSPATSDVTQNRLVYLWRPQTVLSQLISDAISLVQDKERLNSSREQLSQVTRLPQQQTKGISFLPLCFLQLWRNLPILLAYSRTPLV